MTDGRQKSRVPEILCKLDMLKQMGFGKRWIKYSLSAVQYSILVNRGPLGFFSHQKGTRQEDLLSPFLFILAMEGFSKMLDKAKANH